MSTIAIQMTASAHASFCAVLRQNVPKPMTLKRSEAQFAIGGIGQVPLNLFFIVMLRNFIVNDRICSWKQV
jgi:hypothetical protein